jgi:hypothetical protein
MHDLTGRPTPRRSNEPLISPLPFEIGLPGGFPESGGDRRSPANWGTKAAGFIDTAVDEIGDTDIAQNLLAVADLARQAASALVRAATTWALELPGVLRG